MSVRCSFAIDDVCCGCLLVCFVGVCWCVLWVCAGGLWCVGGVCSVLCRRRDSPPGSWIMVAWLWVVLVVGVLGFLLAAHAGALILVCLVVCVRVLCENSIVC